MRHGCFAPYLRLTLLSLIVLALLLLPAPTALASGTWYVDGVRGNDNNNCKSPQTACKTTGHAISLASSGDTIGVAAATYTENLTINISLTIHGDYATSAPTIIDGGSVNTVITIPNAGTNVALSKLTIQNGFTTGSGGGIYNIGTLTITNSTVSENTAAQFGGGIDSESPGTLTLIHSAVVGNTAWSGGGIASGGPSRITTSVISDNTAKSNQNPSSAGGIANSGNMTIVDSTISGNSAFYIAGIYNTSPGDLTLLKSTISGNVGKDGGGIGNGGWATLTNVTISGNTASSGGGGGIENAGSMTVSSSTVHGNSAPMGGGILGIYSGAIALANTIVADSASGGDCAVYAGGSIVSNGYNLSSDGTCPFNNTGDLINTDPMLGPLKNNGGPTWTQALLKASPAINAGNPALPDGHDNHCLPTDQRGVFRTARTDRCDMGAYEYP